jgi:formylglycine-generating enzyme required for sulfatase activity
MTRGKEPGGEPLFRATQDEGAGRAGKVAIGVVALIGVGLVVRSVRVRAPAPPVAQAASRPPPVPIAVDEGAMVRVPGATIRLGSDDGEPDERPRTEVMIASFEIDVTEVTISAYERCVSAGRCLPPDTGMYCNWRKEGRGAHPVNCLDWAQASAYCAFVGKRLPSEEEWELAARGGDDRRYPWKDGAPADLLCWNGDGNDRGRGQRQGTCPVASYPRGVSPFGVHDMAGNVWEWTSSAYCPYERRGCDSERRVIRGGSWSNLDPSYVRAADRAREAPRSRPDNVGVRCAKTPS